MFFLKRQSFLSDALEGIIDIHNHLLPNIDDGSDGLSTTVEMIKAYKNLGFKGVFTTPHTMEDYYGNDAQKIQHNFDETKSALDSSQASFLLGTASEYMMDSQFSELLEKDNYLTLPNRHLLFEFSYFQRPFNAEELIFKMNSKDLQPILAHPERYRYLTVHEMIDFRKRGCTLQLNLLSISGHYGNDAKKKAMELLDKNEYDFIATDAHKVEHLTKIKELKVPNKILDSIKSVVFHQQELIS